MNSFGFENLYFIPVNKELTIILMVENGSGCTKHEGST
jgi:hypothetical protein